MKKSKSIFSLVVILLLIALFITAALNGLNLGFYKVEAAKDGIPAWPGSGRRFRDHL